MLDQIAVTRDLTDQIGLVAALVEIPVPDLPVVIGADGVVALADVDHHMHVVRQSLEG